MSERHKVRRHKNPNKRFIGKKYRKLTDFVGPVSKKKLDHPDTVMSTWDSLSELTVFESKKTWIPSVIHGQAKKIAWEVVCV